MRNRLSHTDHANIATDQQSNRELLLLLLLIIIIIISAPFVTVLSVSFPHFFDEV